MRIREGEDAGASYRRYVRWLLPPAMNRSFRSWSYTVGHSELLLRSLPADGEPESGEATRVDILFEAVSGMLLLDGYPSLEITLATPEQQATIASLGFEVSDIMPPYILSDAPLSFVVAGHGDSGPKPCRLGSQPLWKRVAFAIVLIFLGPVSLVLLAGPGLRRTREKKAVGGGLPVARGSVPPVGLVELLRHHALESAFIDSANAAHQAVCDPCLRLAWARSCWS